MKEVLWTDEQGLKHRSLLREHDLDELAPQGILKDPPDVLRGINWEQVAKDLHNQLVDRGLWSWDAVQAQQNGVTGAVLAALKKRIVDLYRREQHV